MLKSSIFILFILSFSSISSLRLGDLRNSFTLTCTNFSMFHWLAIQADCKKRNGETITTYIEIDKMSIMKKYRRDVSSCIPKKTDLVTFVSRLYCNIIQEDGSVQKFEGDLNLGDFIENIDGITKRTRDFKKSDFQNVVEMPNGEEFFG